MNTPQPVTREVTIDLLRHGEVQGGACYRGSTDDALTITGFGQMQRATKSTTTSTTTSSTTSLQPWDKIVSSPLQRCVEFARYLSKQISVPLETDNRAKEIYFGDWEGKKAEALLKETPELIKQYWQDPINNTPPNGETLQHFEGRAIDFWHDLAINHQNQHLLVVTHAGIIRMIIHFLLNTPLSSLFNINVPHACMSRIHISFNLDGTQRACLVSHSGFHINSISCANSHAYLCSQHGAT